MTRWARGDVALSISYTAIASLLTVVSLPLVLGVAAGQFLPSNDLKLAVAPLSLKVFAIATLPVLIGVVIRQLRPSVANGFEQGCSRLANLLFAVILLATLVTQ